MHADPIALASAATAWQPASAPGTHDSAMARFVRFCAARDYAHLLARADAGPAWFWQQVVDFLPIAFSTPFARIVDASGGLPWTTYCSGGRTNIVSNCLDRHRDTARWEQVFIVHQREDGTRLELTYRQIDREVCKLANGLRALGLGAGDAIGIYMPMIPQVAIALLAVIKIGAIAIPLFSGFGREPIVVRLNDGGARALITVDHTRRRGAPVDCKAVVDLARLDIPTLAHVIVHESDDPARARRRGDVSWQELVADQSETCVTASVDAEAPYMLVYTSGTTGLPKGTVHSHVGCLLKMLFDVSVLCEFGATDRMLWMSDMGWVVGPIQIIASAFHAARLILAEGAFNYPEPDRIWRLVDSEAITWLGLAPTIARHYMHGPPALAAAHDLSSLRIIVSTGEAWTPDAWNWLFEHICRRRVPILNYTGGTEIGGGILGCTVLRALKPCCFNTAIPGMGAAVVDDQGRRVGPGVVGELALTRHSAGLTRGLWRNPERYLDTYWRRFANLWVHGDFAFTDDDGMWYVLGRSDDTLKVSGRRTGPAEIEAPLLATGRVSDVAVVGLPDPRQGEVLACVCVPLPAEDVVTLRADLIAAVEQAMGKALRPREVIFVTELPKTRTQKIMRRVVKAILLCTDPGDLSSLANPDSLTALRAARRAGV